MNDPVRFGIAGLGRSGWDIHAAQLRQRPDVRIVAVADPVPQRRAEATATTDCQAYESLEQMLDAAGAELDVVVIATPSYLHTPEAIRALEASKHVVCEKPMALSLADADAMLAAAGRAGRKLFIHHQRRFSREYTHLEHMIASGRLGRIFHIRNTVTNFIRRNDWQCLAKNGGGQLNNTASHLIEMVIPLMGEDPRIADVWGDLQQIASAGDVEDHVKILLRADNGCTADIEVSTAEAISAPGLPRWILCGTHGTLTLDGARSILKWFDPAAVAPLGVVEGPANQRKYGNDDVIPWQEKQMPPEGPHVGSFYDNVMAVLRNNAPMRVKPQSVREVIRIIELVRASAARAGQST